MLTKDAIAYFGSQAALARALGIKQPSVQDWGDRVPRLRQLQIERITAGRLKAEPDVFSTASSAQQQQSRTERAIKRQLG